MLIGEIEGTVSTEKFSFRAYKDVRRFDFVAVKSEKEEKWVLAQIADVEKHPDGKTTAEAIVVGYREKGLLKAPRYVLKPGSMIYTADEDVISEILGLTTDGLYLGRLDSNRDISIYLNPEDLYKHLAILAKTGAGKSYATGVLIEELLEKEYPVIILDPHGEYKTLGAENSDISEEAETKYNIAAKEYSVERYTTNTDLNPGATPLQFPTTGMDVNEIQDLLPTSLTSSQLGVLYTALKELKREEYTLQDVVDTAMNVDTKAKWGLLNALDILQETNILGEDGTDLQSLISPGEATIIDLKGSKPEIQEMAVYKLAKELFALRKRDDIPPFILVIEEAHNFVPERSFGKAVSSEILRTIASEGRKFGLGLVMVSQRPARVDKNVLSQCNLQMILRLTNPNDLSAIGKSFEGVTSDVKDYISGLPPGTGLLLGKEYPIMIDVRVRRSKHGGTMKDTGEDVEEICLLTPRITLAGAEKQLNTDLEKAYYPCWMADGADGRILIDAVEGTVKAQREALEKGMEELLHLLKMKTRSLDEIREKLDIDKEQAKKLLNRLQERGLVKSEAEGEGVQFSAAQDVFDREVAYEEVDGRRITKKVSETTARETARKHLEALEELQLVYYPYYTAKNRVFDAITGEEL